MDIEMITSMDIGNIADIRVAEFVEKLHKTLCLRLELLSIDEAYFTNHTFEQLQADNYGFYKELVEDYETSYANPRYCIEKLPIDIAEIASNLYYEVLQSTPYIVQKNEIQIQLIIQKCIAFMKAIQSGADVVYSVLKVYEEALPMIVNDEVKSNYEEDSYYTKLCKNIDLSDLRYLFRYGVYISKHEIAYAEVLSSFPQAKIEQLAKKMVDCYLKGFQIDNKVITDRTNARIVQIVGLENIGKCILSYLHEKELSGTIAQLVYKNHNAQAIYDYEKSRNVYNKNEILESSFNSYKTALNNNKQALLTYNGNIIMVSFGQEKVELVDYESQYKPDYAYMKRMDIQKANALSNIVPKSEISYTGMAYPVVDISNKPYKDIFLDIMKINLMDDTKFDALQESLIQVLDQGEYVTIKGYHGNKSKIDIAMRPLLHSEKETNFVNCGAATNVPVGEVYTSPQLKNSNGIIHIQKIRISKIEFIDMMITIKDGFVSDYTCKNFKNEEENRKFMKQHIFHNLDSLPIGEFALGTNTYAYAIAKKDEILYKLHTLIYEKLGPHIALGDTCFRGSEDHVRYSHVSGKKIVAVDNEVSIKRKASNTDAYFGIHYDLTIPYDEIGSIIVHTQHSDIIIVENGRFKLPGFDYLNDFLKESEA